MERILEDRIIAEAKNRLADWRKKERKRYTAFQNGLKRSGRSSVYKPLDEPNAWSSHNQFDPRYCIKHARFLSSGIIRSIRSGTYAAVPSRRFYIPKENGQRRTVDSFAIPDAAICGLLSEALRERNSKIFSSNSYAFRPGMSAIDAIVRLSSFMKSEKVFVSKYDFQDYFGSVDHAFISNEILGSRKFNITRFERTVIESIINHEFIAPDGSGRRGVGFPQGNSISLFLANAVGTYLDEALDKRNGNYIRYSDDSIVISYSYEDAIIGTDAYSDFTKATRVKVNTEKASGISILSDRISEMRTSNTVDFLGYSMSKNSIKLSDRAVGALKRRCSKIIYRHLLLYPKRYGLLSRARLGRRGIDWDLVSCIYELRRMLYGNLKDHQVHSYLDGRYRLKKMPGDLSYYCLVGRVEQFAELDGWLVWAIHRALRERLKMINVIYPHLHWSIPTPASLVTTRWFLGSGRRFDVTIPSFTVAWRAGRKSWLNYGHLGVDGGWGNYTNVS
ncbi:reverse transcriptase domain-containing protein [Paracoccus gahaiensis]|uniref:reverse transcriptase domain-containing protein n=1 Tax=Paracoccus gahaiensis TaxID=1706839 RepID=UPI00145F960B|nr:reverse transcriptase domain-containing protein [Paracoccus gahaiensis]